MERRRGNSAPVLLSTGQLCGSSFDPVNEPPRRQATVAVVLILPTESTMAGTADEHSTPPRPNSPISETEAVELLMDSESNIHAAAERLNTAIRSKECGLWLNGDLISPNLFAVCLAIMAWEVDGRPHAKVMIKAAWDGNPQPPFKSIELDADEVRLLLLPTKTLSASPSWPEERPEDLTSLQWEIAKAYRELKEQGKLNDRPIMDVLTERIRKHINRPHLHKSAVEKTKSKLRRKGFLWK